MGINELLSRLIKEIKNLSELFYQNRRNEGCKKMETFLRKFLNLIDELHFYKAVKKEDIQDLNAKLQEILEALENKDYVLVADILQYDLIKRLEELKYSIDE